MKLSKEDVAQLTNILSTCSIGNIESIIIEDGTVRGVNEARTFVILSDVDVPKLPQKMGVSKLSGLKQRLDLFNQLDPTIEVKESERGEISTIEIVSGKSKANYRCTSTALIKAPKSINDQVASIVSITPDELKLILSAIRMVGSEVVQLIIGEDDFVTVKLDDTNAFSSVLSTKIESYNNEPVEKNTFYYPADILQSVLKSSQDTKLLVGKLGTIRSMINGYVTVILPRVGDET